MNNIRSITPTLKDSIRYDYFTRNFDNNPLGFNPLNISLFGQIVNLWECVLNEAFLNVPVSLDGVTEKKYDLASIYYKLYEIYEVDLKEEDSFSKLLYELEKSRIEEKTDIFPEYFLGQKLIKKDETEWEDFKCLIRIRNTIIHYKFRDKKTRENMREIISHLKKRKIKLASDLLDGEVGYTFFDEISTKECVNYFINLIFKMVRDLNKLLEESSFEMFRNNAIYDIGYNELE